ncbi:MAG: hypothetical protein ACI9FJ_001876 [Alteromonadaceae bacterium]|jgi:hypothetical protein
MRIQLLASAKNDLLAGYDFYQKQSDGLGKYFVDNLYTDIDRFTNYCWCPPSLQQW